MARNRPKTLQALFPPQIGQWLGPLLTVAAAALLLGAVVIASGVVNLAASVPHPEGWADLLHTTFTRSVAYHAADIVPPADLATTPIAKGAMLFDSVCANCHGVPGKGQSLVALSMRPTPQYLPAVISQYSDPDLFWIVRHGVKYSAMPAWPTQDRADEIWAMVAFLRALPTLDAGSYQRLTAAAKVPAPSSIAAAPGGPPKFAGFRNENNVAVPATGFGGDWLGADPVATCDGCHGAGGVSPRSGGIPVLGLLNPQTIRSALTAYAAGTRHSGFMQPIAAQLTAAQIEALAQHYGNHRPPGPAATPAPHDAATLARGGAIATSGTGSQQVTPCQQCHEISRATRFFYPAIAGQDWRYLRDQLRLYRDGVRHADSPVRPMAAEGHRLSDPDIDAVAAWYASRQPEAPAPVATAPTRAGKQS